MTLPEDMTTVLLIDHGGLDRLELRDDVPVPKPVPGGRAFYKFDRIAGMGIEDVPTAPLSPWQNPYVERVVGSVRRECSDHVIIQHEGHLRRILSRYLDYCHGSRTHLSLVKDALGSRPGSVGQGTIVPFPKVGGLHHRYETALAHLAHL